MNLSISSSNTGVGGAALHPEGMASYSLKSVFFETRSL
jgi:hypothetical protein